MKEIPNEISPSELEYGAKIGQGQYGTVLTAVTLLILTASPLGTVFAGKCRGLTVAIKKLKVEALDPETLEDFRKEVSVLRFVPLASPWC